MTKRIVRCVNKEVNTDFCDPERSAARNRSSVSENESIRYRKGSVVPCLTAFSIYRVQHALTIGKILL